jgi:hypothetical protein
MAAAAPHPRYPHLFEPLEVGPITIPNRIVRSAHGTLLSGEKLIAYHEARARGGVGMSTLEATGVHRNAPSVTPLYSDDCIPIYRELMARIRPYGMKMFQQLYHPGSATRPKKAATQVSASPIPNPMVGGIPVAMSVADIEAFEAKHGRIPAGSWVLMRTDWSHHWSLRRDARAYQNYDATGQHTPGPSAEAVRFLVEQRDVLGFGSETIGTDAGQAAHLLPPYPCHTLMHGAGKYGLQCLAHLEQLPPTGALIVAAPLKIEHGSGSPLRVFALVANPGTPS